MRVTSGAAARWRPGTTFAFFSRAPADPSRLREGSLHARGRCCAFPGGRGTLCISPHWVIKAPVFKQDVWCEGQSPSPREEGADGPVTPGQWPALHLSISELVTLPWGVFCCPVPHHTSFPSITAVPPGRVAFTRRSHQDPNSTSPAGSQSPGVMREAVSRV